MEPFYRDPRTGQRTIDITPGAGWRRALHKLRLAIVLLVVVPLVWFFGALAVITLLGLGVLVVAGLFARALWLNWRANRGGG